MELTPFDSRINNPTLHMIKLLIPYLPPKNQRVFAIYIKFIEFQNTLSSFHVFKTQKNSTQDMINEIRPYLPADIFESIDQILNLISMMEMFQSMSENTEFDPMEMYNMMFSNEQGGDSNA